MHCKEWPQILILIHTYESLSFLIMKENSSTFHRKDFWEKNSLGNYNVYVSLLISNMIGNPSNILQTSLLVGRGIFSPRLGGEIDHCLYHLQKASLIISLSIPAAHFSFHQNVLCLWFWEMEKKKKSHKNFANRI